MTPLVRTRPDPESMERCRLGLLGKPRSFWAKLMHKPAEEISAGAIENFVETQMRHVIEQEMWGNELYTIHVERHPEGWVTHLSIKRNDKQPITDWRHKQQIKNEIAGEDAEAIELYPAEERVVDSANQYHLWCFPPGQRIEVGWEKGFKDESGLGGAVQRGFTDVD